MNKMKIRGRWIDTPARYRLDCNTHAQRGLNAGHARISKALWQALGGFANPCLHRVEKSGRWTYWQTA